MRPRARAVVILHPSPFRRGHGRRAAEGASAVRRPVVPFSFAAASPGALLIARPVRLRVSPLSAAELPAWSALSRRLPAVTDIRTEHFDGAAATFAIDAASGARLCAQLRHLATRADAHFTPTPSGKLSLTLRGQPARPCGRVAEAVPVQIPGKGAAPRHGERQTGAQ